MIWSFQESLCLPRSPCARDAARRAARPDYRSRAARSADSDCGPRNELHGQPFPFPITVTLSGSSGGVVNTAVDGSFLVRELASGGAYTVSPSGSGLYFAPATFGTAPGSVWVPFVNRQFGTQIWNNGGGVTSEPTTHWRFVATFPKISSATYGFYHLSISDSTDPNSPADTHCHIAGYINGYPDRKSNGASSC